MTWAYSFDHDHGLAQPELAALIGGKGANLVIMTQQLGLPVPPGFTISTEACKAYLAHGWPTGLDVELREQVGRIELAVGRRFGDASDPLLVSVRSGAPVSMPGMLDTILNLGLNAETEPGLAASAGDSTFAASCRTRLDTMYKDIVGVDEVPADPWQQLRGAVEAVFRSWNSDRAISYREKEGINPDLGTAVTVQAMVFGNRGTDSATGVLFTRNPATGENTLYGDVLFGAQGEDVVAGTHATEPISVLDERLPAVGAELRRYAAVARAPQPGHLRHRVHHRGWAAVDAAEPYRQAHGAGGGARRGRDGPGRGLPLEPDRSHRARGRHPGLSPPTTATETSGEVEVVARGLGASPGLVSGAVATTPNEPCRWPRPARTSCSCVRRPRPMTSTAWPSRSAS